ncbi:MAG TPA: acid phosphatase, partial [Polyangia bacterium]|nr:acid phosphatase [Polyangia bacterium]
GAGGGTAGAGGHATGGAGGGSAGAGGQSALQADVQNIVIIYAENRSFDGLFGNFPGANGLSTVLNTDGTPNSSYVPQKDRDGTTPLSKLPRTWGGATAAGNPIVVPEMNTDNIMNGPFEIETTFHDVLGAYLTTADVTMDIAHKFFENQMELNGGTNDMFASWEDAGGITLGHWDYSKSKLYALAQEYVLADNFFMGAYGGSFLNHQYLICACAPTAPTAWVTATTTTPAATINVLTASPNSKGVPQLVSTGSPASALDGKPVLKSGAFAPLDYFGSGDGYRAVNTIQPAYQPSGNYPATGATAGNLNLADPNNGSTLPPQTQTTIGDLLTAQGVNWAWYATAWDAAIADATANPHAVIYAPAGPRQSPDFQTHHQPFNYYAAFDPNAEATARAAHLKDYTDMVSAISAGTLPAVSWYKPTGNLNQHPGYANLDDGDEHIADLVAKLQAGPQWNHMVIIVTYDEYGGQWDHVASPKGDLLGPGERIPAIIISPYAKKGTVDHTQYDTGSTLRLITKRFGLPTLPGLTARDTALTAVSGGKAMGDLTNALTLP